MAGIQSVLQALPVIQQGLNIATSAISNEANYQEDRRREQQSLRQLQQTQRENLRKEQENAALEQEEIAERAAQKERRRQDALKRAVARQRAQFGASGTGSSGGSAQAVLLGLVDETEEERQEREALDNLRFRALDLGIEQQQRLNVLQRTQLQERQNLDRLTSRVDRVDDIFNTGFQVAQLAGRVF